MQYTNTILMIRPVAFGYNPETAANNYFQHKTESPQEAAIQEFDTMVETLRSNGIEVIVVEDTLEPHTPDSIFPNNWISFHANGNVVLYPMYANNRRLERRDDILELLEKKGHQINTIIDYTDAEKDNIFLEGTGSVILDRENRFAYASVSERTHEDLCIEICEDIEYIPIIFSSYQTVNNERLPIYHTNVMMCVADKYVIICTSSIDNAREKKFVLDTLKNSGKEIIDITELQMHQFAGNMLQVAGEGDQPYLVMSKSAYDSLNEGQISQIKKYNPIIPVSIPTIETNGGGSARCMMAEVFLPKK